MGAFGIGRGRMPLVAQNKKIVPDIIIVGATVTPIASLSNTAFIQGGTLMQQKKI